MATDLMEPPVAKKKARPGRPKSDHPVERKPMIFQMRGSAEFKAWVERLAAFDNRTTTSLAERSMIRYALEIGFPDPAPER